MNRLSNIVAAVSLGLVGVGVALGAGETGSAPRTWDCSATSCGAAGNGPCGNNEARCCCKTGPGGAWATGCYKGGDCGSTDTTCQMCS